ncbi:hypothetical protein N7492_000697 [Penicillium capsulatum]|uniref:Major facilitator superfamily (MFS) profile domain-containing protein n=1 Tax=Penicillium capsulatum TaxID=69766 RepID=A0A9W9ITA3_9EURO|nr:hypothetical protein N7492_000697 [Penicillium capsulatum]KAJ6130245.1 hypothetical protein N7512_003025 [Penicillium capsulatum]
MPRGICQGVDEMTSSREAPGTEILFDDISTQLHQLKHRARGDTRMLLVPQPSTSDPNDPLRWSSTKKSLVFFNGCWFAFMGAITGPIMAAGMIQLSKQFGMTLQQLTYANGACLINQGVWNFVWMPFAVKYGRRPIYLASTLLMGIACIWLALASTRNYTVFIGLNPSGHVRPGCARGNELGPMLSGFIVQGLGMNWAFWIVATFIGANLICMFFYMPETKFTGRRPVISHSDRGEANPGKDGVIVENPTDSIPRKTWLEEMKFWSRGDPDVNLLHVFLRPFVLLAYPTVVWSCCVYGLALSWNVILGAIVAQLFAPPPYNFNSNAQGLFFLSPFIGSLFGVYLSGPGSDWIANYLTRGNQGIREPEMRLPVCLIAAFFTFSGALWFGLSYEHQMHWAMPVVGAGILSVGSQMGTTLGMNYALDCHQELSVEIMVTIAALKSCIAWIWTWVINDFVTARGVTAAFMTVAAINVTIYLFCVPFYYQGKRVRWFLHRQKLFRTLGPS